MAKITVQKEKCKGCFLCVTFCPRGVIKKSAKVNKMGAYFVEFDDTGACQGCCLCSTVCPDCCIEVYT